MTNSTGWLAVCACLACGGSGVSPPQGEVTNPEHHAANSTTASIARRTASVPESTDRRERLVFLRGGSVWMMNGDGRGSVQLTVRSETSPDEGPRLSPDGTRLVYASQRDGVRKIYVLSLEELIATPITDGDDGGDGQPTWSPDGTRLAFMRGEPSMRRDLYVVPAAGGPPERLLEGDDDSPEHSGGPAWSPDGTAIVLSADRRQGKGTGLWRLDLSDRHLERLTPESAGAPHTADIQPAWFPNGSRLAFASNRHVPSPDHASDMDVMIVK